MKAAFILGASAIAVACVPLAAASGSPATNQFAVGERAYQQCYACHALSPETIGADGPHLGGIVGRRVASVPGYRYSAALENFAKTSPIWTEERLDAFLAEPERVAPGNAMGYFGMDDPAERAALIAFLVRQP